MLKRNFILPVFLLLSQFVKAQQPDTANNIPNTLNFSHLRISLLTCGMGNNEVWEVFGHTGIRIVDSLHHTDMVYNYGTFEFSDDFELKFAKGKLLYNLSLFPYQDFMPEYIEAGRSVEEQVLLIGEQQKIAMKDFLDNNALPANKYYKYDFFLDNCATRIRDILPKLLGNDFKYAQVLPKPKISFREIMNQYFYYKHWERVGVNILLGSRIDKNMTNDQIMFLPDYLRDGLAGATFNQAPVATKTETLLKGSFHYPAPFNLPFFLSCIMLILTALGLYYQQLHVLGLVMSKLLMLISGLLGCIILIMWFGTDHQACRDNFNILWALPTNLLLVFTKPKGRSRYALIAIFLIVITLILHFLKIQQVAIFEMAPFFAALVLVYANMMIKNQPKHASN